MPAAPILSLGPVERQEWRLGLRNTARESPAGTYLGPASDEGQNIGGGVSYSPETSGTANVGQFDPCVDPDHDFTQRDGPLTFLSWAIYAWEDCAVLGSDGGADVALRARRKLERQTSRLVEETLWTGALSDGSTATLEALAATVSPTADNRRLASTNAALIDGPGSHDLTDALGYITEYVADTAGAIRAWIHVEPRLVPFLAFYGQGFRDSSRGIDQALGDHRIVAGTGYDGSGPTNQTTGTGESWIYVTTPVRFIEGPVDGPTDPVEFLDRSINRFRFVAQRAVLAEWDLTLHGAIKVCLPGPGPECTATGS